MEAIVLMALVRLFLHILDNGFDLTPRKEDRMFSIFNAEVPLCRTCTFAHIVTGYTGKTKTFCCYSGPVRPIEFAVSECTDYRDKTAPAARNEAGFVCLRDIRPAE